MRSPGTSRSRNSPWVASISSWRCTASRPACSKNDTAARQTDRAGDVRRARLILQGAMFEFGAGRRSPRAPCCCRRDTAASHRATPGVPRPRPCPSVRASCGRKTRRSRSRDPERRSRHAARPGRRRPRPCADLLRRRGEFADGVDVAEHVGHMAERDELRALRQHRREALRRESPFIVDIRDTDYRAGMLGGAPPRQQVGVVLGDRDDDLVARLEIGASPRPTRRG